MIKMTSIATIIYHATVLLLWSWRTTTAVSSDILQDTSSYYILQPSSTLFVMEEITPTILPSQSSVLDTAVLTSLSTLSTSETPMQSPCFIGGRTIIKENHSVTSSDGLYLQFVKRSNCGLSKRTFAIRICYRSSSSIFVEATLWIRTLNTYNKFTTLDLVQTNLPISLNETCHLIYVNDMTFMGNTFIGIKIANSTSNDGIVLNPSETSNWCVAEGYQINDESLEVNKCIQLVDMDIAVAGLFYPWIPATESATQVHTDNGGDSGIESGAVVGIILGILIFVLVIFILFLVMVFYLRQRKKSYIISNKSDDGANKIEIFKINFHHITENKTDTVKSTRYYNIQTHLQDTGNSTSDTFSSDPTSGSDSPVDVIPNSSASTYERPTLHSPMEQDASRTFVNPCFFLMSDLPPVDRSRVISCVCAEPIFDCPSDPVAMSSTTDCFYEMPATDVRTLTLQLKKAEVKKIKRSDIRIVKELGSGAFGFVSLAIWADKHVAVKTLNSEATKDEKITFLQEATIMSQFAHDNVIKLLAIIKQEPVGIVIEFASRGDLHMFLIESKPDIMEGESVLDTVPPLLLQFGRHVAAGMHYLSSKFFVHRDLAARNILITEDLVCKIADFGMSRDLEEESFYIVSGGKIPVKWTAPEALHYRKFTTLSDVWSFGCVLYEMWSLGSRPFENTTAKDAIVKIAEGYRLPPPPGCPKLMYKLMIRCWHPDPESRPIFALIIRYLNKPDEELLSISEEDRQTAGIRATTLGYPLSDGFNLYKDLQLVYANADNE